MFWTRHPGVVLAAFALALRIACAIATEIDPIFPAYYYTDSTRIHASAVAAMGDLEAGRRPIIDGALSERIQTGISLVLYRRFGVRPFVVKLFNALLGTLAIAAFFWAASAAFSARASLAAGYALAAWPSHVFYTSQNLKEAPVGLLAYAALAAAFAAGLDPKAARTRSVCLALVACLALLGAGAYRSYVLISLAAALLTALALAAFRTPKANALTTAAALAAALALYPSAARAILHSFHTRPLGPGDQSRIAPHLIPATYDNADPTLVSRPTSPEGISNFRRLRQSSDRTWAAANADREIATQIYPGASFKTWIDVLLYLPKGAFTVLFMPLPGIYPMDGKAGRYAAAAENILLLLLAALSLRGAHRGGLTPQRFALLAFFAVMTTGAALLEFDLGSAGRHKLLYLPMLFPFAAEEALRLLNRQEPK